MRVPHIGVLGLQGDVLEHMRALTAAGANATKVRRAHELQQIDGLVLPGGESSTISKLIDTFDLREPLEALAQAGFPMFGSCAGMIMLARQIEGGTSWQHPLGAIDMTVRRNGFGRQVDSFETDLNVQGIGDDRFHAVFIRAPWVSGIGPGVEVLSTVPARHQPAVPARIVCVRQGLRLAASFHPEIGGDVRVHELFVSMVQSAG